MSIMIIVRHGFSESNRKGHLTHDKEGYPLTQEGKAYLVKASDELKKLDNIKEIISSPVQRARQTAEILANTTNLKIKIDERLAERQMGKYNNQKIPGENPTDYNWHVKEILSGYPNGFEKWESLIGRTKAFLDSIPPDDNIIVVTHGDIIKAIIAEILDLDEFEVWGIRAKHGHFTVIDRKNKRILALSSPIISDRLIEKIKRAQNEK